MSPSIYSKRPIYNKLANIEQALHAILGALVGLESHYQALCFELNDGGNFFPEQDLRHIATSLHDIKGLSHAFFEDCMRGNDLPDFWRTARHDLRTCAGAIQGYAEIILENLPENTERCVPSLKSLISMSTEILPLIEKLRMEDQEKTNTHTDWQNEYSFCFVGETAPSSSILIVDDDPEKRGLLRRRLSSGKHKLLEAENGFRAMEIINSKTVDLILLDILMPEMSGYDVLSILKRDPNTAHIPVLVVSSLNEMDSVVQCIRAGAEDYLQVPINSTLLFARINACLAKKMLKDRERHYQKEMKRLQYRLKTALQSMDQGFAIFDQDDRLVMMNKPFQDLYPVLKNEDMGHITHEELLKANMDQHVYLFDRRKANGNQMSESGYQEFWLRDRLSRHREPDVPYLEQLSDGRWLEIAEKRIPEGGIVVVHKDVTRNVLQEQEYHHLATHDKLTGLVNRAFFESSLEQVIDSYRENKNTFSVMFFDLDGFKAVNDAFGHEFGDYLLKSVSEKLLESLRSTDILARMGGDEFCALVYDINSNQELSLLAGRCLETVGESVEYKGQKASFGVSIGIACYPYHGQTGQMLIAQADAAMYRAKKAGKNRYRFAEQYED